jgi:hypothetical protein
MHVPEHHKISTTATAHGFNSDRKIAITPVNVGMLPIPTTDAGRIGSKTGWTAMG